MPGPKTLKSLSCRFPNGLVQIGCAPATQEARPDSRRPLSSRTTTGSMCPVRLSSWEIRDLSFSGVLIL